MYSMGRFFQKSYQSIFNFINPNINAALQFAQRQYETVKEQVTKAIEFINQITQPMRDQAADKAKMLAEAFTTAAYWAFENLEAAWEHVKKATDPTLDKVHEIGKKVSHIAEKVKDQVVGIGEAAMSSSLFSRCRQLLLHLLFG